MARRQSAEERYWKASAAKSRATRRLLTALQKPRLPKTLRAARRLSRILSFDDCEGRDEPLARAFKRILAGEARHENRSPRPANSNAPAIALLRKHRADDFKGRFTLKRAEATQKWLQRHGKYKSTDAITRMVNRAKRAK